MTTKKDLVEAHSFSRRRLITAFVSGAPGGREVEPVRPGRTIVGGVALAVLLVAGAAVTSVLHPRSETNWDSRGLVVTDQGARYIVTKDKQPLRPIINLTSAQLILGLSPKTPVISAKTLGDETPGPTIGIAGAPESLPTTGNFVESGWTACTSDGQGLAVDIAATPDVRRGAGSAYVVTTGAAEWLVAEGTTRDGLPQAYRYQLPKPAGPVVQALFGEQVTAQQVPASWLALFPQGTPIGTGGLLHEKGSPASAVSRDPGVPSDVRSGDLGKYAGEYFLVLRDGVVSLNAFQAAVYQGVSSPRVIAFDRAPQRYSSKSLPTSSWPQRLPDVGDGPACAQLATSKNAPTTVRLATRPGSRAWPSDPPGPRDVVQTVDPGKGAFVYTGQGTDTKGLLPWMVDARGAANQIGTARTVQTLGLGSYPAPVVPDAWIKVLGQGVELSTELALCPPDYATVKDSSKCAPSES